MVNFNSRIGEEENRATATQRGEKGNVGFSSSCGSCMSGREYEYEYEK
jgi:hypothetical protein